ncbi:ATP-binding cassette domain-containing protein [Candidatus Uhrbacteria bacterium]|nr:ATP-binding cassette domain-containing protein [Candidatus Uhrbacteria bacterium]
MESFLLQKEIYAVGDRDFHATVDELTSLLDVQNILDVQVRKLSLGQRMKCELIAALLHSPKVLFLDEPTIGLDVVSQQKMREFIKKYNTLKKTTILLTSHYMEDVEALCERVVIINFGQIIYDGALADLVKKYVDHKIITVSFTKEVARKDIEKIGNVCVYEPYRASLEIADRSVKERAVQLLTTFPVNDILIDEVPVDEVIRKIFETAPKT